jgi:hypothetical protein
VLTLFPSEYPVLSLTRVYGYSGVTLDRSSIFRSVHIVATDTGEQDSGVAGAGESANDLHQSLISGWHPKPDTRPPIRLLHAARNSATQRSRRSNSSPAESVVLREAWSATSVSQLHPERSWLRFCGSGCAWCQSWNLGPATGYQSAAPCWMRSRDGFTEPICVRTVNHPTMGRSGPRA